MQGENIVLLQFFSKIKATLQIIESVKIVKTLQIIENV